MNFLPAVLTVAGFIGLIIFISFLLAAPVMLLWNGCLVDAFTVIRDGKAYATISQISWLQAWGILILSGFLFKSSSSSKS